VALEIVTVRGQILASPRPHIRLIRTGRTESLVNGARRVAADRKSQTIIRFDHSGIMGDYSCEDLISVALRCQPEHIRGLGVIQPSWAPRGLVGPRNEAFRPSRRAVAVAGNSQLIDAKTLIRNHTFGTGARFRITAANPIPVSRRTAERGSGVTEAMI